MLNRLQLAHIARIAYEADRAYWTALGKNVGDAWDSETNSNREGWIEQTSLCFSDKSGSISEYHAKIIDSITTTTEYQGPYFFTYAQDENPDFRTSFEKLPLEIRNSIFLFHGTVKLYDYLTPSDEVTDPILEKYECHGLDTQVRICFYEQDHYYLSNFSSFRIVTHGAVFSTSEHLYHWTRFNMAGTDDALEICNRIMISHSAHDAFKIAQDNKKFQVDDWDGIKFVEMKKILVLKVKQHPYIQQKLLQTGDRLLVENSWRDDVWGEGPEGTGQNMLGKIWMNVRDELRTRTGAFGPDPSDTQKNEAFTDHGHPNLNAQDVISSGIPAKDD